MNFPIVAACLRGFGGQFGGWNLPRHGGSLGTNFLSEVFEVARLRPLSAGSTLHRRLALRGETVSTIINDARIELAQRHIKTARRSLTETAQLLGFSGLPTFSRWFQRQFGSSATTWRKIETPVLTRTAPAVSRVVALRK